MSKIIQTSGREGSIILACSFFTRPLCASQRRKSSTLKLSNSGAPSNFRKTIAWLCQRNRLSFLTRRNHRRRYFSRPANGRLNGSFASHSKRFFSGESFCLQRRAFIWYVFPLLKAICSGLTSNSTSVCTADVASSSVVQTPHLKEENKLLNTQIPTIINRNPFMSFPAFSFAIENDKHLPKLFSFALFILNVSCQK